MFTKCTLNTEPNLQLNDTAPTPIILEKSEFQEFTELTHYLGHKIKLKRCQTWKRHTNRTKQCGAPAATRNGFNVCYNHGGAPRSGQRTTQGKENQRVSVTTHGQRSNAVIAKTRQLNATHKALSKLAVATGLAPHLNVNYTKPVLSDVPALLEKLNSIKNE
jgi:hypothetical protein